MAYLLEQRGEPYALLDLDYLSWGGMGEDDRAAKVRMMLRNLAAVGSNYRDGGSSALRPGVLRLQSGGGGERAAAFRVPLRGVRPSASWTDIEQRLASDIASGRNDDLREAASSIAASEGIGVEDLVENDHPVPVVARDVMTWLGWL